MRVHVTAVNREPSNISKRERILDQAAILFAQKEFDGASMRDVARMANVSQSLIHYHYETKEQLFAAVFDRHMKNMNSIRISLIASLVEKMTNGEKKTLEELLELLVRPWIELSIHENEATREFARFVIRSAYHDAEWSQQIAAKYFTDIRRYGVKAFRMVVPEFDDNAAFRAYFLTLSMFFMPLGAPHRLAILAGGHTDMVDPKALLEHGILFAAAGIRAMQGEIAAKSDARELEQQSQK